MARWRSAWCVPCAAIAKKRTSPAKKCAAYPAWGVAARWGNLFIARWAATPAARLATKGRTGIHELFVLDEPMRNAINAGKDSNELFNLAAKSGMLSLHEDGLRKVAAGMTTLDEVARVTQ